MSGWTAEDLAAHYERLKQRPQTILDLSAREAPNPKGRYVITGAPRTKKNHSRMVGPGILLPSATYGKWHKQAVPQAYQIKDEMRRAGIETPITQRVTVSAAFYQDAARHSDECGFMQALGDWLQAVDAPSVRTRGAER